MGAQVDWVYSHTDVETKKWLTSILLVIILKSIGFMFSSLDRGGDRRVGGGDRRVMLFIDVP